MSDFGRWDRRTAEALQARYLAAGGGPGGSGSADLSPGAWRAKRQHLVVPMDADGEWLDVGCANGHLLATLPAWAAEQGVLIVPYGLELLPPVAELARTLHPELADRIWTGSVMTWAPTRRFRYVTVLDDCVPPDRLGEMVARVVGELVEPGGRAIVSSYADRFDEPRPLVADLLAAGHRPDGVIHIDRPARHPLQSAWFDVA